MINLSPSQLAFATAKDGRLTMQIENCELNTIELDAVSGGMKWTPGTRNDDVIDARGGQFHIFGWTITLDIKGNVSSAGRT